MPKYMLECAFRIFRSIEIEADDPKEAFSIAMNTSLSDWTEASSRTDDTPVNNSIDLSHDMHIEELVGERYAKCNPSWSAELAYSSRAIGSVMIAKLIEDEDNEPDEEPT